jgi:caffeoyl-CoA O-methyltransferase
MSYLVDEAVEAYAEKHTSPPAEHLDDLAAETHATLNAPQMLTGAIEGRFLQTLVFALRPSFVLEIGTYSGYSALSMAAALAPAARIVTCEIDDAHADVAERHIAAAGFSEQVTVRRGPALQTIASLDGPFDLVFVDADKAGYQDYFEAVLPKLSDHGLIVVDNVLWSGRVAAPAQPDDDEQTIALRAFNDHVLHDPRVVCVMLTVRDGVTLIRKA